MDNFLAFLKEYWQQALLILSAVGFVIVKFLELRLKRHEIKYNLFHKEKVDRLMKFYDCLIEFDHAAFSLVERIRKTSLQDFHENRANLKGIYNKMAASTLPFELLADEKEFDAIISLRTICKTFLKIVESDDNLDSTYIIIDHYKRFTQAFRPTVSGVSTLLRKGLLKSF